jgi:hypothetical protein
MKRSAKIILAISLVLAITVWTSTIFYFTIVLAPYVLIGLLIAGHAAYTILGSVLTLKDHPE